MIKKTVLLLIFVLSSIVSFAQQDTLQKLKSATNLRLSYNSSVVYPGIRVGTETLLKRIELTKYSKNGSNKIIYKDRFLNTHLSFYNHPTFHTNTYLTIGYSLRRTRSKGFFTEFNPELGYSRTFLNGTTYIVDNSNNVSIKKFAGYNYILASIGLGIGYDFSKTKMKPISVFYKANLISMFPYNSTIYLRPTMELGIIYKPKNFLPLNTRFKKTNKNKKYEK
jgi:hypothetical protein